MTSFLDIYSDEYFGTYGVPYSSLFPAVLLTVKVELLLNGTWTDITSFVYQRDSSTNINIVHGHPDGSPSINPGQCTMELNNRGGVFSLRNPDSPFYPYIQRNTQIRVSAQSTPEAGSPLTYRFWGEVTTWPIAWDQTGRDVFAQITASGICRRLAQAAPIGSAVYHFYMSRSTSDPLYPVAYWPCEDGQYSDSIAEVTGNIGDTDITWTGTPTLSSYSGFVGSSSIPVINNSSWTGDLAAFFDSGQVVYNTPGTFAFQPPGVTTSVDAICVGGGGGGGGTNGGSATAGGGGGAEEAEEPSVAVTPGNVYTVTVGSGGQGGTPSAFGASGGNSTFQGDSVTVTAHGGSRGQGGSGGNGGSGSSNTHHNNGGNGYYSASVGGGGGSSGSTSGAGNSATSGTGAAPSGAGGGVGGNGGGSSGGGGGGGGGNSTKVYVANATYAYAGSDGTYPNTLLATNRNVEQGGDLAHTFNGHCKSWIVFPYATMASDLSGATIIKVTLQLDNTHWYNDPGGTVALGWDTRTSFPSTLGDPSGANIDINEYAMGNGVQTLTIANTFANAFKSSGATSLVLYKHSNNLQYYGKFNGSAQSYPPTLTITYST